MSKKLHRNGTIRLSNYDYGRNGFYFVTICTKYRSDDFGTIINDEIKYTDLGKIAEKYWMNIPKHFPFVSLDELIIMPDHVHGIIVINKMDDVDANNYGIVGAHNVVFVGPCHGMRLQENVFSKPKCGSLWTIINHFKGSVTRWANKNNIPFAWQPRYYERIVRNERELNNIRRYIRNNPKIWRK